MKDTARAAAAFGVEVVNGFTGRRSGTMLYSFPPNDFDDDRARVRGLRRALGADHRRLRRRGRSLRARGAPDRDRVRLRHDARRRSPRSTTARASGSTSTRATSRTSSSTPARVRDRVRRPHLPRPRQGLDRSCLDGRRSILGGAPQLRRGRQRGWDFVSPGHGDVDFEDLLPGAEPDRLDGPALDRVGGLRDGSRLGRARTRWRSCARTDFAPSDGRLRRRHANGGIAMSQAVGIVTMGQSAERGRRSRRSASACSATRSWARPTRTPTDARLHDLAAAAACRGSSSIAGRDEEAVAEAARPLRLRALRDRLARRSSPTRRSAVRQRRPEQPPRGADDRGGRGGQARHLREAARARPRTSRYEIWQRVAATGVKHMCAFNYRFVPAVRLAREMIEAGELGEIRHFRGRYLQEWGVDRRPRSGASTRTRPARARSATSART